MGDCEIFLSCPLWQPDPHSTPVPVFVGLSKSVQFPYPENTQEAYYSKTCCKKSCQSTSTRESVFSSELSANGFKNHRKPHLHMHNVCDRNAHNKNKTTRTIFRQTWQRARRDKKPQRKSWGQGVTACVYVHAIETIVSFFSTFAYV